MNAPLRSKADPAPMSQVASRRRATTPEAPSGETGFRVELTEGVLHVTLFGQLPLNWLGQLGAALSRRGIGIHGAYAERDGAGGWQAVLQVRAEDTDELEALDYVALCDEHAPESSAPQRPRLTHFELWRAPSGMLELHVEGPDELGFLSALFGRLAFHGLFAARLSASTHGDRIDDALLLRSVGGSAPSDTTEKALRQTLTRLCAEPPSGPQLERRKR